MSSFPIGWSGPLSGLVLGGLFGYVLQRGGLGNGCRLTGQLRFKDWTVFNVMFTAILVAAAGLWLLETVGLLSPEEVYVPTTYLWATLLGGAMVGAGMALGGYCPGTSVVGAAAGRIDGVVFFIGLVLGAIVFAGFYDPLQPLMTAAEGPEGQTLQQLLHLPAWLIILALAVVAWLVNRFTRGESAPGVTDHD
ncbi:YeeE/YedE thiosulfate transporter family protein [Thermomonas flagellata]|uniref:YeeE/YedE thiosulfate transporter family protein n=1 Tax=Thermomonas flagellata TaxID=2888524 RepID=UPI001F049E9D|nr:YeeE/YedE thiosulfate transporter family protein [Thermomonas flagellata]